MEKSKNDLQTPLIDFEDHLNCSLPSLVSLSNPFFLSSSDPKKTQAVTYQKLGVGSGDADHNLYVLSHGGANSLFSKYYLQCKLFYLVEVNLCCFDI
jgi:hypothetical protein